MHAQILTFILTALAVGATDLHAQARTQLAAAAGVPLEIHLQAGAHKYDANATGECRAADQASIYGLVASQFAVSHNAGKDSLNLTLWQPKNAENMVTLSVLVGGKRFEVDTVKAGPKKDTKGSAKTTLQRTGNGATLTIAAVTAAGEKLSGTIKCGGISPVRAEGG